MSRKKIEISKEELEKIKEKKRKEKTIKIYKRYLFLEMKYAKKLNKDIAVFLDVSAETLSHWSAIYREGGLDLLSQLHYEGRRTSVLTPLKEKIKERIEKENIPTIKFLNNWIQETFNVSVGESWLHEFCKKNSIYLTKKRD